MVFTLFFLMQLSFAKTDVDHSAFCQLMLSADVEPIQALSESLLIDFRADSGGGIEYLENMHGVMAQLIQDQTITQAQADDFFAEKSLGSFARIFLKYTLVELKERKFGGTDLLNFVSHFGEVYTPANQVRFAVDVARRMLLTLNEETDITSAHGLQNFMAQAQFFGVEPAVLANFLKLWVHVRVAHPKTIVHFILGNIRAAGRVLREHEGTGSRGTWTRLRGGTAQPDVATQLLELINIPDSISQPRASFKLNIQSYPSFLARYWATSDGDLDSYLKILGMRSPFALEAIVHNQLPETTFRRLRKFVETALFKSLSESTVRRGLDLLAEFEFFAALETRLKALPFSVDTEPPTLSRVINLEFVSALQWELRQKTDKDLEPSRTERSVRDKIMRLYRETQKSSVRVGAETFLLLAKILTVNLHTNVRSQTLGTTMALVEISRDIDLEPENIAELVRLVGRQRVGYGVRAGDSPEFEFALKPGAWGNPAHTAGQSVDSSDESLTPELETLLLEIREFLLRHGIFVRRLETIQHLMRFPDSPKTQHFLEIAD